MYQFFVQLLQPYSLLFVVIAIAIVLLWRRRVASRRLLMLLTVPMILLTAANLPVVADLAVGSLEWSYPTTYDRPDDIEAIVVLCGYVRSPNDQFPEAELGPDTLYRCIHAARLYHQGKPCLVIVSGGTLRGTQGPSMAETMKKFLLTQGIPERDLAMEDQALSGYENAVETGKLLSELGKNRVLLVTSAVHMPRAAACFHARGICVTPAACDYLTREYRVSLSSFWPSADAAKKSQTAAREWLGLVWYWFHDRL
jgi:uncharacterized SAM-binding protein YcdF (DUF218 family)